MDKKIRNDLGKSYGIFFTEEKEITGGYLNKKWMIDSNYGNLVVKQFSNKRYNKNRMNSIEASLQRQITIRDCGVPCPLIYQLDGQAIRIIDDETYYMVMEFCPGESKNPDSVDDKNMRSLGSVCASMHKCFMQFPKAESFIDMNNLLSRLKSYHENCISSMPEDACISYRQTVKMQEDIIHSITDNFLCSLPLGIAHKDFAADNILFHEGLVSAIIDFDTNDLGYQWQDIGRILLSLGLKNKVLNIDLVNTFITGYQEHLEMNLTFVADALRLSWCIETPWWIQMNVFSNPTMKAARFRDEMIWLTENWFELEHILARR